MKKKKNNCTIHLLIFSYERNTMQSILWLFVVSISQNVFLIALLIRDEELTQEGNVRAQEP